MSMDDKRQLADQLIEYCRKNADSNLEVTESRSDDAVSLQLKSDNVTGVVTVFFLQYTIAEYRILDSDSETVFYLHFELEDLDHAEELYHEMLESLRKLNKSKTTEVLLCCSCGLTTSYFTIKLNESAETMGVKTHFEAVPYEQLYDAAADKDVILIAPQIGYQLKNAKSILSDKIVTEIPVQIFSNYDVLGLLNMVRDLSEKKEEEAAEEKPETVYSVKKLEDADGTLLVVSIVDLEQRTQLAYRLYDHGQITASNQIVKDRYRFSDVKDVISLVKTMNPQINAICLVTPGSVSGGKLTYEKANIFNEDIKESLEDEYGTKVWLMNFIDAVVLGYATTEKEGEDTAFYFLPTGSYLGNIGMVVNNRLVHHSAHMGGRQLDGISTITTFPQNPYTLAATPEGNVELAARFLTGLITYTGCDHVAFYAKRIPDPEELRRKIGTFLEEEYIPVLHKVDSIREYLYTGALKYMEGQVE
ncbi:MAG: hypothetical protein E7185_04515 [Erysipelotrichaceae bacterium]|nr:hypothetical protein [Erysipelotrichaceae bacterium]